MSRMIEIKGKYVSEDTIVEALKGFEEKYEFKAGDVVALDDLRRIIVKVKDRLYAIDPSGEVVASGQAHFRGNGYKKIGELKDLLK